MVYNFVSMTVISEQIRKNAIVADREFRHSNEPTRSWSLVDYGTDHRNYARWFGLQENYFLAKCESLSLQGRRICGLDLMSNTAFLDSLHIEGVAIGLTRTKTDELIAKMSNRHIVTGDIVGDRKRIWPEVDKLSEEHQFTRGFDVITLKGNGGLPGLSTNPLVHYQLLQELWKREAIGGTLVAEIPDMRKTTLRLLSDKKIIDFWNTQPGVTAQLVDNRTLVLEKSDGAPETLPVNYSPTLSTLIEWNSI